MLNRRLFVTGASAAILAGTRDTKAATPLTLWGPPASPSIVLAKAAADGLPKSVANAAVFKVWKTPDEMRAGLSSGNMSAVVVPTYVAANLYNRGLSIRLVNVLTNGLLYVVAPAGTATDIAGLKGKRIAVPFRNDMPDYILQRLMTAARLSPDDLTIDYSASPPEAVQLLLAGRADAALLSEPASSAAIARAATLGKTLERVIDCQAAWGKTHGNATLPQAGLVVTEAFGAGRGPDSIAALQGALESTLKDVLANPKGAAASAAAALELPAPIIERSIPSSNLVVRPARAARADLEPFFKVLAEQNPRIIGGKLPDDRFYAL